MVKWKKKRRVEIVAKKTIALTGSSGNMGFQGFKELYKYRDKYNIVLLNRDSEKNRKKFKNYIGDPAIRFVWGDLTNFDDVKKMVDGADYVLHVGGMVSPAADYYPKRTLHTNVTAAENIVKAIKAQPDPDKVKVVYIGTVAETGDRNPPIHWARTGDPIKISVYDHYAISKVKAEAVFAESGLKYWVSLRQSGILYPAILKNMDPIMFHVPINGVLEWATIEDSGRLLEKVCCDDVPDDFWRKFYNIGSGKEYRITNYEFEELLLGALGLPSPKLLFEAEWFILRNFHGQWYADSDKLDDILHFRANVPIKEYFDNMAKQVPAYYRACKALPKSMGKLIAGAAKPFMKKIASTDFYGTLNWKATQNKERISAYFGSMEAVKKMKSWADFNIERPTEEITLLDHGYDETKPDSELDIEDMRKAAEFRGGKLLSQNMTKGDLFTPLEWESARGNAFFMTPNLVLKGGHWCPDELPWPWDYDKEAKINPFFAQVWYPLHDKDEDNYYDESIFKGFKDM